jgi:hypothetical protein
MHTSSHIHSLHCNNTQQQRVPFLEEQGSGVIVPIGALRCWQMVDAAEAAVDDDAVRARGYSLDMESPADRRARGAENGAWRAAATLYFDTKVTAVAYDERRRFVFVGLENGFIVVYRLSNDVNKTLTMVREVRVHTARVMQIVYDSATDMLITCARDTQLCCYHVGNNIIAANVNTGKVSVFALQLHASTCCIGSLKAMRSLLTWTWSHVCDCFSSLALMFQRCFIPTFLMHVFLINVCMLHALPAVAACA